MALPDIKDVGILAGFSLWGWPWHGLCTGGVIDLGGGLTKTITPPAHGSAWLIDRALPAITRSAGELAADAALGHSWRNYALISGGRVYDTALGANKYIHVDEAGERWLIGLTFGGGLGGNSVRITFSIVQFGLFGEGQKTPITVIRDVSCHDITYLMYGYLYQGSEMVLEDVWTNGSRALVSFGLTRTSTPPLKDLFSVIEITITGTGGADGSGLSVAAVEVMQDTELSQGAFGISPGPFNPSTVPEGGRTMSPTVSVPGGLHCYHVTWDWDDDSIMWLDSMSFRNTRDDFRYARFAYYNSAGVPKAARLQKKYEESWWYVSHANGGGGAQDAYAEVDCAINHTWDLTNCGVWSTTTVRGHYKFGIYLLENDTVIDSLELHQDADGLFELAHTPYNTETQQYGDPRSYISPTGLGVSGFYNFNSRHTLTKETAVWQGSLVGVLSLPAPPSGIDPYDPPLDVDDVALVWRRKADNHRESGSAIVTGTAALGIERMDAKAAAFYKPGATRIYGNILTPLGIKTTSMTPADGLYFAWQRKTGDHVFGTAPICYV